MKLREMLINYRAKKLNFIPDTPISRIGGFLDGYQLAIKHAIDAVDKTKTAVSQDGELYVAKINAEMNIQLLLSAHETYEE